MLASLVSRMSLDEEKRCEVDHKNFDKTQNLHLGGPDGHINEHVHLKHDAWLAPIPSVPTLKPTMDQMDNFVEYIASKESLLTEFGGVKIQPPRKWKQPSLELTDDVKFFARVQSLPADGDGSESTVRAVQTINNGKETLSFKAFKKTALKTEEALAFKLGFENKKCSVEEIEKHYWRTAMFGIGKNGAKVDILYGADFDFESKHPDAKEFARVHGWKRDTANAGPKWHVGNINRASVLRHLPVMPGITRPMFYIGCMFSSFLWHVEDALLYSVSYVHKYRNSKQKTWYVVPPGEAEKVEKYVLRDRTVTEGEFDADTGTGKDLSKSPNRGNKESIIDPDFEERLAQALLASKTTLIPPYNLAEQGITVFSMNHTPGTFVVTAPRAYHCGFNSGFNLAEATNFALPSWLKTARKAEEIGRRHLKPLQVTREYLLFREACEIASEKGPWFSNKTYVTRITGELETDLLDGAKMIHWARMNLGWDIVSIDSPLVRPYHSALVATLGGGILCGICYYASYFFTAICRNCREIEPRCLMHWGGKTAVCNNGSHKMTIIVRHDPLYLLGILESCEKYTGIELDPESRTIRQQTFMQAFEKSGELDGFLPMGKMDNQEKSSSEIQDIVGGRMKTVLKPKRTVRVRLGAIKKRLWATKRAPKVKESIIRVSAPEATSPQKEVNEAGA